MRRTISLSAAALLAAATISAGAGATSALASAPAAPATTTAAATATAAAAPVNTDFYLTPGTTSGTVTGTLARHTPRTYTFVAGAGQEATITLRHSMRFAHWTLTGPEGPSGRAVVGRTTSRGAVSTTVRLAIGGRYELTLSSADAGTYQLGLSLPRPIRLRPGQVTEVVSGRLPARRTAEYTLDARRGQPLRVAFSSEPGARASWTLVGPHGQPLHSSMAANQHSASLRAPSTGTYHLTVRTDRTSSYTLRVTVLPH